MARIVHCKKEKFDVYIGRPSKWGNPYSHLEGTTAKHRTATREATIRAYEKWITKGEGKYLLRQLDELRGKVLGCWCGNFTLKDMDNLRCHGQILLNLLADKLIMEALEKTK